MRHFSHSSDGHAYKEDECSRDKEDVCTRLTRIAFKPDSPNHDETASQVFQNSCSELHKQQLPPECDDELYHVDLVYIQGPHFLLVGTLSNESNEETTCPKVVSFASIGEKISFSFNQKDLMHKFSSHKLGTASLGQLFSAEEAVKSIKESEFDLEKNTVRLAFLCPSFDLGKTIFNSFECSINHHTCSVYTTLETFGGHSI